LVNSHLRFLVGLGRGIRAFEVSGSCGSIEEAVSDILKLEIGGICSVKASLVTRLASRDTFVGLRAVAKTRMEGSLWNSIARAQPRPLSEQPVMRTVLRF
jgi:hypothetical protein